MIIEMNGYGIVLEKITHVSMVYSDFKAPNTCQFVINFDSDKQLISKFNTAEFGVKDVEELRAKVRMIRNKLLYLMNDNKKPLMLDKRISLKKPGKQKDVLSMPKPTPPPSQSLSRPKFKGKK